MLAVDYSIDNGFIKPQSTVWMTFKPFVFAFL